MIFLYSPYKKRILKSCEVGYDTGKNYMPYFKQLQIFKYKFKSYYIYYIRKYFKQI